VPWIDSIPADPTHHHKAHAWSLMAGWHPGDGCDRFYRALWEAPAVAKELEDRLHAAGAWDVLDAIAS